MISSKKPGLNAKYHPRLSVLNVPDFDPQNRVRGCGRAKHVPEGARIPQGVRHGDLAAAWVAKNYLKAPQ